MNKSTDWENLRPDGTAHRETEYDRLKRMHDEIVEKDKARIINEYELKRGGMRFAWLIEGAPGTYWIGRGSAEFGRDIVDAVQFARQEDGERVLHWLVPNAVSAVCRVVEHGFELPPHPLGDRFYRHKPCPGNDPSCPCQDGDACHYQGPNAWPIPEGK